MTTLSVVTGAAGGIGRAIAEALAARGDALMLVVRNEASLAEVADSIAERFETPVTVQTGDITQSDDRKRIVTAALEQTHPLSLWVNNAGISQFSLLTDTDDQDLDAAITSNLLAPMQLTKVLLQSVDTETSALEIVNIGSAFGSIGYPSFAAYSASKFGLRGFSQAVNREYADRDIRVRYFAPRATRTAFNTDRVNALNEALGNAMDSPEVVAQGFMRFLASRKECGYFGWPERFFIALNNLRPDWVSGSIKSQLETIRRFAKDLQP